MLDRSARRSRSQGARRSCRADGQRLSTKHSDAQPLPRRSAMADIHVIVDDCTTVAGGDVRAVRTRDTAAGSANWRFNRDRIAVGLPDPLDDNQMDWLEIHSAIFAADRAAPR